MAEKVVCRECGVGEKGGSQILEEASRSGSWYMRLDVRVVVVVQCRVA